MPTKRSTRLFTIAWGRWLLRMSVALIALALLCTPGCVHAASTDGQPIPASDVKTLRGSLGKQVTVRGHISSTGQSRSGHQFLNFENSELTAVCFPEQVGKFVGGKPANLYRDRDIELTGRVELYRKKLQIRLYRPGQIRFVSNSEQPSKKAAQRDGVKLKKIGKDTWLSPIGLRYHGRDPNGLTRVEHIERHTKDDPSRDGPHGVFDGGSEVAFAVIDEAWSRAQEQKLRAQREGDRSSYTVSLGRRIGYLGGRTGARKGHPPLTRLFIVFKTGTKDIVTAFPK